MEPCELGPAGRSSRSVRMPGLSLLNLAALGGGGGWHAERGAVAQRCFSDQCHSPA